MAHLSPGLAQVHLFLTLFVQPLGSFRLFGCLASFYYKIPVYVVCCAWALPFLCLPAAAQEVWSCTVLECRTLPSGSRSRSEVSCISYCASLCPATFVMDDSLSAQLKSKIWQEGGRRLFSSLFTKHSVPDICWWKMNKLTRGKSVTWYQYENRPLWISEFCIRKHFKQVRTISVFPMPSSNISSQLVIQNYTMK